MTGVLLLITGTGRSGTSTMSGTLHYLGLHVPGPFLGANESNPKGFFESKWAVRFHNRITKRAGINIFDSRPNAFVRAQQAVRPANRSKLVEFLREQRAVSDQVVVKDPRSVWFQQLWREACAEADFDIKYISMLRHPAEVIGSRTTYYSDSENSDEKQRRYQALTLARWINNSLINERATRGYSRAFVGYDELLTDWRKVATRLQDEFDLRYATNVEPGTHHAVDDFIDPDLRRHRVTWQELDLPEYLQSMAEQVWDLLQVLAEHGGVDEESSKRLDEIATSYAGVLNDAIGISQDAVLELIEDARENAINEYRAELTIRQSDEQAAQDVQGMRVGEVGSRDLLRVIASRAKRKLTRA